MRIWVSGSIARDLIMDFPGRFADFIDVKKIHVLSLSFTVRNLRENIGGTAANIVYNLACLGERPDLVGAIGYDQPKLRSYFQKLRVGTSHLTTSKTKLTSAAYIITDRDDNQITGFHPGAVEEVSIFPRGARTGDYAVIAAQTPGNMTRLAKFYRSRGIRYIFDPGQQAIAFRKTDLRTGIAGAAVLIGNDYEIALIASSLRGRRAEATSSPAGLLLRQMADRKDAVLVRTLGPKGSEIYTGRKKIRIGIAKPRRVVDPTGAGDAYRAGFLKGLILGYNLKTCGQLGATV
ncbi:MAG TPA: carbohydrate kinase family protein, partial [Candidatus Paceibacterota bacterium]